MGHRLRVRACPPAKRLAAPAALLVQTGLIDLDPRVRILAPTVRSATVRSLGAIDLGRALHSGPGLISLVSYDKQLLEAAGRQVSRRLARVTATGSTATGPAAARH